MTSGPIVSIQNREDESLSQTYVDLVSHTPDDITRKRKSRHKKVRINSKVYFYPNGKDPPNVLITRSNSNWIETKNTNNYSNKVVFSLIAMLQGVEVLCNLAILYLYKDDFNIDPAILTIILGFLKFPWTIKPVWAIISDWYPIFGYRRRSYVALGALLCVISTSCIGLFAYSNFWITTLLLLLYYLGSALCNVIGEALVVEEGRRALERNFTVKTVSIFFAFRKFSFVIMSYFSGLLLDYLPKQNIFLVSTVLPLIVLASSSWIIEDQVGASQNDHNLGRLIQILKTPELLNSSLFIFILMSTPSAGSAMFYFMTNKLNFTAETLGRFALLQSLTSLLGILTYMYFFNKVSVKKLIIYSTLIVTPFCLLPMIVVERWNLVMGLPDSVFIISDNILIEFIGELQTMPILVLAARLCPEGFESTIYSFIISAFNLGSSIGSFISAGLTAALGITSTEFKYLSVFIIICSVSNLIPLLLMFLISDKKKILSFIKSPRKTLHYEKIRNAQLKYFKSFRKVPEVAEFEDDLSTTASEGLKDDTQLINPEAITRTVKRQGSDEESVFTDLDELFSSGSEFESERSTQSISDSDQEYNDWRGERRKIVSSE